MNRRVGMGWKTCFTRPKPPRNNLPRGLGEADRMAVVAFNGDKLEMLSSWSMSTPEIRRVLEAAKQRSAKGLQRELTIRRSRQGGEVGRIEREFTSRQLSDQMKRVILASTAALRSFANPPGRKAMLLLAGGWPYNPRALVMDDPWRFGSLYDSSRDGGPILYQPLYDTANRLGYTLYTVDVPGFRGTSGSAEHRTLGEAQCASRLSSNRESTENSTLMMLADQTGGRAFLNASAHGALEEAVHDTRAYYWLGFTPEWRGENRRHRIRVHLRDPSLKVRTRRSPKQASLPWPSPARTRRAQGSAFVSSPPRPPSTLTRTAASNA